MKVDDVKFDDQGLVAAIVQSTTGGKILMLGYMNRESLELTLQSKLVHFFSRSRNQIWLKGETSGNHLDLLSIELDCDKDALLVTVSERGPACHTGERSCFDNHELLELE
jgi:phosphoribosyl-AMP cyclohydrolase